MKTITLNFKLAIFSIALLFSSFNLIGQNPTNGGFENGDAGWTLTPSGVYTPSVVTTEPRTGSSHLQINYSATDGSTYKTGTVSSAINVLTGQYLHIIGWVKKVGTNGTLVFAASGAINETPSSLALTTSYARSIRKSNISLIDGTCQIVFRTKSSGIGNIYCDDIVAYASTNTVTDIIAPSAATGLALTGNILNWTEGTDANTGVQSSYILRTNIALATAPVLNDQAAYVVTDSIGNWEVIGTVNVGTTSYTDATGGSSYSYAVVHRDLANNNSVATVLYSVATAVNTSSKPTAQVFVNAQNELVISASENSNFAIYNAMGQLSAKGTINHLPFTINHSKGIYVVKVNDKSTKVIIK